MLRRVVDVEDYSDLRIETGDAERREIWFGIEDESVSAIGDRPIDEKEWFDAAVGVGPCVAQLGPRLVAVLHFETDGDAACRGAS